MNIIFDYGINTNEEFHAIIIIIIIIIVGMPGFEPPTFRTT